MTDNTPRRGIIYPKLFSRGYIVGYDGTRPNGKPRRRGWVIPRDGLDVVPVLHESVAAAEVELGGLRAWTDFLGRPVALRVFHVRVLPFPMGAGNIGYRSTKEDRALLIEPDA